MNYELRHKDSILLKFSATENSNEPEIEIFWQNTELQYLLPLDLTVSEDGLSKWLKHRTIPKVYYDDARKIEPEKLPDFELLFSHPFHADKQLGALSSDANL